MLCLLGFPLTVTTFQTFLGFDPLALERKVILLLLEKSSWKMGILAASPDASELHKQRLDAIFGFIHLGHHDFSVAKGACWQT